MKKVTSASVNFGKPWAYFQLIDGELWRQDIDANENFIGEPYRIADTRGYETIIKELELWDTSDYC